MSSRTQTVFHDCWKTYKYCMFHVVSSCLRMLTRGSIYSRAAFISLSASNCAAFIRGRRLFEGGVYSRKYGKPNTKLQMVPQRTQRACGRCEYGEALMGTVPI